MQIPQHCTLTIKISMWNEFYLPVKQSPQLDRSWFLPQYPTLYGPKIIERIIRPININILYSQILSQPVTKNLYIFSSLFDGLWFKSQAAANIMFHLLTDFTMLRRSWVWADTLFLYTASSGIFSQVLKILSYKTAKVLWGLSTTFRPVRPVACKWTID